MQTQRTARHAWFRTDAELTQMLTLLTVRAAMSGKPSPVAALALARLEGSK